MGMRWSGEDQAVLLLVTLRAWGCEKTSDVVLRRPSVFLRLLSPAWWITSKEVDGLDKLGGLAEHTNN